MSDDLQAYKVYRKVNTYQASGTSAEHESAGAQSRPDLIKTMTGTRRRLNQGGVNVAYIVYLEDLALRICNILSKATAECNTMTIPLE
jgi:hypothetical protein